MKEKNGHVAVIIPPSETGDVYIVGREDVPRFITSGWTLGGYANTEEEAESLAETFC